MESYSYLVAVLVVGAGFYFLRRYIAGGICRSKAQLDGKTVIITGANSGIGKATAIDLAKRNARVILACRSVERGEQAAVEVRKMSGNDNVVFVQLDLASLTSVRQFAEQILQQEPQIDTLINNAGVGLPSYTETEDGFETIFAVNHLGHFLLTNLLLDRLKESPAARIVNVSARGYMYGRGKINFDDLNHKESFSTINAYCHSKLANIVFTRELAKRLEGTNVTTNSLHPGAVRTKLTRNLKPFVTAVITLLTPVSYIFLKSPLEGAQTSIHCAVCEEMEGVTGQYLADCKVQKKMKVADATDDEVAEHLWRVSAEMVGLNYG